VFEAMEDMARVKAGLTRALQGFDLTWSALVPTGTIPRPRRIVEALCEDDFLAFGHFTVLAIAWWLAASSEVLVCDAAGLVVVRLVARTAFSLPADGGYTLSSRGGGESPGPQGTLVLGPRYRYAYVAWVDQSYVWLDDGVEKPETRVARNLWLLDRQDRGFQQVSLVPVVPGARLDPYVPVIGSGSYGTDDLGYPEGDDPDWSWPDWAAKQCSVGEVALSVGATWLRIHLEPLENAVLRCSPACVLTDAEYRSHSAVGLSCGPAPWQGYGESPSGVRVDESPENGLPETRTQGKKRQTGLEDREGG
jgi:hypothetical protein